MKFIKIQKKTGFEIPEIKNIGLKHLGLAGGLLEVAIAGKASNAHIKSF